MQELGKFSLKINVILNGLEKYRSFSINLSFIVSFQFLTSSLDSLVKNSTSKYLSQEFDNKVLNLVTQKGFYPLYVNNFEKFKEQLSRKEVLWFINR